MAIAYETNARKLEHSTLDAIVGRPMHHHDPKKIIPFTAPADAPAVQPSRTIHRAPLLQKLLVIYPRYLCVAMLLLFVYLQLATFAELPAGQLDFLWISAYALAGSSALFSHLFPEETNNPS